MTYIKAFSIILAVELEPMSIYLSTWSDLIATHVYQVSKPCHIPLKFGCSIIKNDHIRPTSLIGLLYLLRPHVLTCKDCQVWACKVT